MKNRASILVLTATLTALTACGKKAEGPTGAAATQPVITDDGTSVLTVPRTFAESIVHASVRTDFELGLASAEFTLASGQRIHGLKGQIDATGHAFLASPLFLDHALELACLDQACQSIDLLFRHTPPGLPIESATLQQTVLRGLRVSAASLHYPTRGDSLASLVAADLSREDDAKTADARVITVAGGRQLAELEIRIQPSMSRSEYDDDFFDQKVITLSGTAQERGRVEVVRNRVRSGMPEGQADRYEAEVQYAPADAKVTIQFHGAGALGFVSASR
jgi:hypothetical protein